MSFFIFKEKLLDNLCVTNDFIINYAKICAYNVYTDRVLSSGKEKPFEPMVLSMRVQIIDNLFC